MKKFFTIALSVLMLMSLLTGCSKEVTVDAAGLQHMTLEGALTTMTKEGYTAKLVPQEHYELPETITVTMEDQEEQSYSYDPATGELTFTEVTGNITITGIATESIIGTWASTVDFTEMLKASMAADPTVAEFFSFSSFVLDITITFDAEGVCTLTIDEESAKVALETIAQEMLDGMLKMIDELLKQQGVDMTAEDYLAATGMSMDDLREQLSAELDVEDMIDELSQENTYEIRDGKLYIADADGNMTEEDASSFTLADGVLTIEASEEAAEEEAAAYMFPLVLNRVG